MKPQSLLWIPFLATSMGAHGQNIELCGVKVSIGDEREVVEQSLKPRCRVLRHTEKEMTFYWDSTMPNAGSQGSIWYFAGKVTSAFRPSPTFRNSADPVVVMSAFAQAMQAAHDSAGPPAKVSTSVIPVPGAKMTVLEVAFKGRRLSVLMKEGGRENGQDVSISESIVDKD